MKRNKKWNYGLGIMFAMMLLFTLAIPGNVLAAEEKAVESGECGEQVNWSLYSNGSAAYKLVISGTGEMTDAEWTESVPWAQYQKSITEVQLEEGVTSIGNSAFNDCAKLQSISIPESVTSIGNYAFYQCVNLKSIELPDKLTDIGFSAFQSCGKLNNMAVPDSVKKIGVYAFADCKGLKKITLSKNLKEVSEGLLMNSGLTSVTIPAKVTKIGSGAFNGCKKIKSITIPDKVTVIGDCAFMDCRGLNKIVIGKRVKTIKAMAFLQCGKVKNVEIKSTQLKKVGRDAFLGLNPIKKVTFKIAGNKKQRNATIKVLKKKSTGYEKGAWKFK
ncbi:MAG: leucine-rich repeat domain-containing protein [Bacteroidales bacterium]|nr:leucine-rich repeat domain-containing protein [Clostridium sp.]MCM1204800.1 leucine-rich repeat domain-containing protein [Bacteroidales bacterium]